MLDHPILRRVEIVPMRPAIHVCFGRGESLRSRPHVSIRMGCSHSLVRRNGPSVGSVELDRTNLQENEDRMGGQRGPGMILGLGRLNGDSADACHTATTTGRKRDCITKALRAPVHTFLFHLVLDCSLTSHPQRRCSSYQFITGSAFCILFSECRIHSRMFYIRTP